MKAKKEDGERMILRSCKQDDGTLWREAFKKFYTELATAIYSSFLPHSFESEVKEVCLKAESRSSQVTSTIACSSERRRSGDLQEKVLWTGKLQTKEELKMKCQALRKRIDANAHEEHLQKVNKDKLRGAVSNWQTWSSKCVPWHNASTTTEDQESTGQETASLLMEFDNALDNRLSTVKSCQRALQKHKSDDRHMAALPTSRMKSSNPLDLRKFDRWWCGRGGVAGLVKCPAL